jgi:hypothetical protein
LKQNSICCGCFALLALLTPGCGRLAGYGCAAIVNPAIEVTVRDAVTGEPAADGATGTVRAGSLVAPLQVGATTAPVPPATEGIPLSLQVFGTEGTYTVQIEKAGFVPWERRGVRVRRDECGVITTRLDANLERLP